MVVESSARLEHLEKLATLVHRYVEHARYLDAHYDPVYGEFATELKALGFAVRDDVYYDADFGEPAISNFELLDGLAETNLEASKERFKRLCIAIGIPIVSLNDDAVRILMPMVEALDQELRALIPKYPTTHPENDLQISENSGRTGT